MVRVATGSGPAAGNDLGERSVQERVQDEKLRLVWSHALFGGVAASVFAVLLACELRGSAAPVLATDAWLAAKLAVAACRTGLAWRYPRLAAPGGARWQRLTLRWLMVDSAVWGLLAVPMLWVPLPTASMLVAALACVSCAGTFGLQISLRATAAYVVPMLLPAALLLIVRGDELGWLAGLSFLLLLALELVTALRSDKRLSDGLRAGWQSEALGVEKAAALTLALHQSAVKTQFLANISHELRTPLHGILGLARLVQLESTEPGVVRRVALIESSGEHLLSLINDLLDISRVEAGRFVMRNEPFELVAQLEHVAGVYAERAHEKGLVFTLDNHIAAPCWVRGDPARFRQVLHNLLGNAIKFTDAGFIHMLVEHATRKAGDATEPLVACEVSDSGAGIAEGELAHIFEAFRQAGDTSAQPLDGTGLGLTISRDIARAMGGDVTVRSTVGVGTKLCFMARLPRTEAPADAPAELAAEPRSDASAGAASFAVAPRVASPTAPARRVLVAEDNEVNALIAVAHLERQGLLVERVRDGAEAVQAALRAPQRPQLVLMDCRMPVLDGFAATRRIRAAEQAQGLARVPVIALTATAADADRQQCLDAGMDDFLSKPYGADELAAAVERWTMHNNAAAHLTAPTTSEPAP
ncbi:response regulator [soil metagenome]